jgi:GH35 family endo-1,4-beta-xylanase
MRSSLWQNQLGTGYIANALRWAHAADPAASCTSTTTTARRNIRIPMPASSTELTQQSTDYKTASENCLGVPRCAGITVWGITDKYSWVPGTFNGYGAALPYSES